MIEQQHAVARDYLLQYRKGLQKNGVLRICEQSETPMTAISEELSTQKMLKKTLDFRSNKLMQ